MKAQNKVRMSMIALGFAATLMFAGAARAQQEMDPTFFDINPGAPALQTADLNAAPSAPVAAQQSDVSQSNLALALRQDATLEASMVRMAFVDAALAVMLIGGVASIVAYAVWATKRERSSYAAPNELRFHSARS